MGAEYTIITTSLGYKMKVYRSSARDCGPCALRSVCIGKGDFKKIDDSVDKPYYDRMHQRLQTVNREKTRQIRSSTVEPVLGTLVNYLGMRRLNTRGIQQAAKCMLMAAVAYNLKKLMRWEGKKANTVVKALQKPLQNAFLIITATIIRYYCLLKKTGKVNRNYFLLYTEPVIADFNTFVNF